MASKTLRAELHMECHERSSSAQPKRPNSSTTRLCLIKSKPSYITTQVHTLDARALTPIAKLRMPRKDHRAQQRAQLKTSLRQQWVAVLAIRQDSPPLPRLALLDTVASCSALRNCDGDCDSVCDGEPAARRKSSKEIGRWLRVAMRLRQSLTQLRGQQQRDRAA